MLPKRLLKISEELEEIVKRYNVDAAAIEELFFNTNTKTAINVAQARGVILNSLEKNTISIFEYTPLQVKQALVGYGRADKLQMKSMVKSFLNLETMPKLDDTTDALAIAICHAHSCRFNSIV
ncbi:Crossover junction endodeoxyribonuclease RuvC [compost metagenome]